MLVTFLKKIHLPWYSCSINVASQINWAIVIGIILNSRKATKPAFESITNKDFLLHRPLIKITFSINLCMWSLRHWLPPALEQGGIMYSIYIHPYNVVYVLVYNLLPPQYYTGWGNHSHLDGNLKQPQKQSDITLTGIVIEYNTDRGKDILKKLYKMSENTNFSAWHTVSAVPCVPPCVPHHH